MRAFLACVQLLLRQHLRGPVLLATVFLFSVLVSGIPGVGESQTTYRTRSATGLALGVEHLVLATAALVLPLMSLRWRRRRRLGAAHGPLFVQGAALLAHGCFLVVLALALMVATYGIGRLRHPYEEGPRREPLVRTVLARAGGFSLGPDAREHRLRLPAVDSGTAGTLRLYMRPSVRLVRGARGGGGLRFPLEIAWRPAGDQGWNVRRPVVFGRRRAEVARLLVPPDVLARGVELRLATTRANYRLVFEQDALALLGRRAPPSLSLLRGSLLSALAAWSLLAACLWFSGFVSFPIAVAAGLTLAIAAAWSGQGWLPGMPLVDPGRVVTAGQELRWRDLGGTAACALGWSTLALLAPFHARAEREAE